MERLESLYVLSYLDKNIILASSSRPNVALFVIYNLHTLYTNKTQSEDTNVCTTEKQEWSIIAELLSVSVMAVVTTKKKLSN